MGRSRANCVTMYPCAPSSPWLFAALCFGTTGTSQALAPPTPLPSLSAQPRVLVGGALLGGIALFARQGRAGGRSSHEVARTMPTVTSATGRREIALVCRRPGRTRVSADVFCGNFERRGRPWHRHRAGRGSCVHGRARQRHSSQAPEPALVPGHRARAVRCRARVWRTGRGLDARRPPRGACGARRGTELRGLRPREQGTARSRAGHLRKLWALSSAAQPC